MVESLFVPKIIVAFCASKSVHGLQSSSTIPGKLSNNPYFGGTISYNDATQFFSLLSLPLFE